MASQREMPRAPGACFTKDSDELQRLSAAAERLHIEGSYDAAARTWSEALAIARVTRANDIAGILTHRAAAWVESNRYQLVLKDAAYTSEFSTRFGRFQCARALAALGRTADCIPILTALATEPAEPTEWHATMDCRSWLKGLLAEVAGTTKSGVSLVWPSSSSEATAHIAAGVVTRDSASRLLETPPRNAAPATAEDLVTTAAAGTSENLYAKNASSAPGSSSSAKANCCKQTITMAVLKSLPATGAPPLVHISELLAESSSIGHATRQLVNALRFEGYCIVTVPAEISSGIVAELFSASRAFFDLNQADKDLCRVRRVLCGYRSLAVHECYDFKSFIEPGCRPWPAALPEFKEKGAAALALFEFVASTALDALSTGLGVPTGTLRSLLDGGVPTVTASTVSETCLRVNNYRGVMVGVTGTEPHLQIAAHCDNTLLTVSPASTIPALQLKALRTGNWVDIEANLEANQFVLFAGDQLARITCNFFPACLHRPSTERTVEALHLMPVGERLTRLSSPFFLRARYDAVLDSVALRSPHVNPEGALRDPVPVSALDRPGVRDWAWKAAPYYCEFAYEKL